MITPERLADIREQKEAAFEAACREAVGLSQALSQNLERRQALSGALAMLAELQGMLAVPAPPGPAEPPVQPPE